MFKSTINIENRTYRCYFKLCPVSGLKRHATKEDTVLSQTTHAVHGKTAPNSAIAGNSEIPSSDALLEDILSLLDDEKAEDVVSINLRGKSEIADFMVVCSGRSTRQVSSLSEKLTDTLKQKYGIICKTEGKDQGDWALIDAGDIIVHVFRPEVREFYQLEKMWMSPGPASAQS